MLRLRDPIDAVQKGLLQLMLRFPAFRVKTKPPATAWPESYGVDSRGARSGFGVELLFALDEHHARLRAGACRGGRAPAGQLPSPKNPSVMLSAYAP